MSLLKELQRNIEAIKWQRHQFLLLNIQTNNENKFINALEEIGVTQLNINMLLATKVKELPISKRKRAVKDILREVINGVDGEIIYFERIEYLFDEELKQDPIRLFEYLSGNKVLLVKWPGKVHESGLVYATPDHPEYFQVSGYEEHLVFI